MSDLFYPKDQKDLSLLAHLFPWYLAIYYLKNKSKLYDSDYSFGSFM